MAGFYLSIPYLMMLSVDLREKGRSRVEKQPKEPEVVLTEEQPATVEQAEDEFLT